MQPLLLPPSAAVLVPSLRGIGYSLQTAIADIIDNSISAQASTVYVTPLWNDGNPSIAILDDGVGMDGDQLLEAMRFGSLRGARSVGDLGRFGLGLKTASLSQARMLTVASIRDGAMRVLRWDIDHIVDVGLDWELLQGAAPSSEHLLEELERAGKGTLVLWQNVDFGRSVERPNEAWFRTELGLLESHLALVFHRYLEKDHSNSLTHPGRPVAPWDPFLESFDPPSDRVGAESIPSPSGRVRVSGFVMPHPDRFKNDLDLRRAGGPEGWNAHQGLYVYRARRLLTFGGWMGLGRGRAWTREEASRLARIRVDIPQSADSEWQIDVKKSVARPPPAVRPRLEALAESVRQRARKVHSHRGARNGASGERTTQALWVAKQGSASERYRLDRSHPAVVGAMNDPAALDDLLQLIERSLPVERIWLDRSEAGVPDAPAADLELVRIAVATVRRRMSTGECLEDAIAKVALSEPFDAIPGISGRIRDALRTD